jgi:hypothetical protein
MTTTHTASAHAAHDTMLVASLADHSLAASERAAAEALVEACGLCAALLGDLVALSAATRAMPTPARPRSYTLTADDAARLHPTGLRRWVVAFGTSRDALSRPLAIGLTTLGLAGLLVATVPSALFVGGTASAPGAAEVSAGAANGAPNDVTVAAPDLPSGAPAAGAVAVPSGPAVDAAATAPPAALGSDRNAVAPDPYGLSGSPGLGAARESSKGSDAGSGRTNDVTASGSEDGSAVVGGTGIPTLILVSGVLLVAGLGLFLMRWAARRFGDG